MTIRHFTQEDFERVKRELPPGIWKKLNELPYSDDPDEDFHHLFEAAGISYKEKRALLEYKSLQANRIQEALRRRESQRNLPISDKYINWALKPVPYLDSLMRKNTLPEELSGRHLYRGTRIDYGKALIKSGKKPGDTIRDPRYQSFSMNPGTAMYHTSKSQFGDADAMFIGLDAQDQENYPKFKRQKKVLLEHIARGGDTGIYTGSDDAEMEVIYPRNKNWKISGVRDEDVTFAIRTGENPIEGKQNVRIYTVERKKKTTKTQPKRKITKPAVKKPVRKVVKKVVKKCKCK